MKKIICSLLLVVSVNVVYGQQDTTLFKKKKLSETEVNFLFNYYEQDGQNSAVTGGTGTEALDDRAGTVIVNMAIDSVSSFSTNVGVNYYTSASTDRINSISSASGDDFHTFINMGYETTNQRKNTTYGLSMGGAIESDYLSFSIGGYWSKMTEDNNREWTIAGQVFMDRWQVLFPDELRGQVSVPTDKRRSYNLSGTLTQVINPKLQMAISTDAIFQNGLLSTPFHRVYYADTSVGIERMPSVRFKHPTALRLHYFISDFAVLRLYGRYYWDSFGINAGTFDIETPIKIGRAFTVSPFYRFHTQTKADFFEPYALHDLNSTYHTSDYDLSTFQSHKYGIGIRLSPVYGVGRFMLFKRLTMFKYMELRYAQYQRNDGLEAFIISADLGFRIR